MQSYTHLCREQKGVDPKLGQLQVAAEFHCLETLYSKCQSIDHEPKNHQLGIYPTPQMAAQPLEQNMHYAKLETDKNTLQNSLATTEKTNYCSFWYWPNGSKHQ